MGARRRAARAADAEAARRSGWRVVAPGDVPGVAWTRAWSTTPHRWPAAAHGVAAALCVPAAAVGPLLGTGWFHTGERGVVAHLRRERRERWWEVLAVVLLVQVLIRAVEDAVGMRPLLTVLAVAVPYALAVPVLATVRRRELTTPAERRGFLRIHDDVAADWRLGALEARTDLAAALPAVAELIDARVPPGAVVVTWSPSDGRDAELATIGFARAGGSRGDVVRRSPAAGDREGLARPAGDRA